MESSGLHRRDTTKGRPLRILSLDGGGVRGYSMLVLLKDFMHQVHMQIHDGSDGEQPVQSGDDPKPKPCDYFDLIGGTGTGGLIAIMLGRLRMDIPSCVDTYVEMTRRVFETDKTIAGIPYRSTMFKASKLEDAIRDCVGRYEQGAYQESAIGLMSAPLTPTRPGSMYSDVNGMPRRSTSSRTWRSSSIISPVISDRPAMSAGTGISNAYLYDSRPNRTKTAVTAVYKGTKGKEGTQTLLRSYRSPKKPPPEFKCTIWQAGRATCATKLAFKPIQLGQSIFLDEGYGMTTLKGDPTYNPSPEILKEAVENEWPTREVGLFLSVGTGKRADSPHNMQAEWWEGIAGGLGDFAEAKRKLMKKITGCEETHKDMISDHLEKFGVKKDNYFRLNVDVGVGEYGMNEWDRLPQITESTQKYLDNANVRAMIERAAEKMARIENDRQNYSIPATGPDTDGYEKYAQPFLLPPPHADAVELPGELPDEGPPSLYPRPLSTPGPRYPASSQCSYQQPLYSPQDKFAVLASDDVPHYTNQAPARRSHELPPSRGNDTYRGHQTYSSDSSPSPRRSQETQAPPLPPKTPITFPDEEDVRRHTIPPRRSGHVILPYPDDDGPPPMVNMARKPEYIRR
ncbi:hypothetical protein MMC22_007523 [Lobaria immixta]|nr:hypothetical protein [Lobaria immixta]